MKKEEIIEKQLALLEDTKKFYSEDVNRRAVIDDEICLYETEDKRHCAIGRKLSENTIYLLTIKHLISSTLGAIWVYIVGATEKEDIELRRTGFEFLLALQRLHDKPRYWDEKGLSSLGKRYYLSLKKGIEDEEYLPSKQEIKNL